ncbi:MAG: hypothetical protein RIA69_04150 [Cyclobacteriaceae bacterium]
MRIYQHPLDEQTLWNHLQSGNFESAIEVVDWYYSRTNPEGFDDPNGITKAEHLEPTAKFSTDLTTEHRIRKRRMSYGAPLIAMAVFGLFFVFLSVKTNSWGPMLIPSPLAPFAVVALIIMIFDRKPMIIISPEQLEFRKSTKEPIKWDNILQIYHYHRGSIRGAGAFSDAHFIEIYRKNAVKPESYNLKDLDVKPTDIVYLINEYKKKYEI